MVDGDPPWNQWNLPVGRERSAMRYSEFDDFEGRASTPTQIGINATVFGDIDNQRRHRRVGWHTAVTTKELSNDSAISKHKVAAAVVNIGAGGICVVSREPLVVASVVQCEVTLPGLEIPLPTVMQVIWVSATEDENYICGLRYVI